MKLFEELRRRLRRRPERNQDAFGYVISETGERIRSSGTGNRRARIGAERAGRGCGRRR